MPRFFYNRGSRDLFASGLLPTEAYSKTICLDFELTEAVWLRRVKKNLNPFATAQTISIFFFSEHPHTASKSFLLLPLRPNLRSGFTTAALPSTIFAATNNHHLCTRSSSLHHVPSRTKQHVCRSTPATPIHATRLRRRRKRATNVLYLFDPPIAATIETRSATHPTNICFLRTRTTQIASMAAATNIFESSAP